RLLLFQDRHDDPAERGADGGKKAEHQSDDGQGAGRAFQQTKQAETQIVDAFLEGGEIALKFAPCVLDIAVDEIGFKERRAARLDLLIEATWKRELPSTGRPCEAQKISAT
ncbi:hypothetical protein DBT53_002655, partial [Aerococcus mictus]|uniref:hypothetical protein n=1 Tax=Aerococcus mictus TaxID=2976810 RepID=UPI002FD38CF0